MYSILNDLDELRSKSIAVKVRMLMPRYLARNPVHISWESFILFTTQAILRDRYTSVALAAETIYVNEIGVPKTISGVSFKIHPMSKTVLIRT